MIHRFLETERATTILSDPQVIVAAFFINPKDEWSSFETQFRWFLFALAGHTTRLITLPLYEFLHHHTSWALGQLFKLLYTKVQMHVQALYLVCYQEEFPNFYLNMPYIHQNYLADQLYGLFPNVPGILCGAGPSLANHFDILKSLEDKALIIGAGSSLNALSTHYVNAHFGGGIDPTHTQQSRFVTNFAYETPLFYLNRFNHPAFMTSRGHKLFIKGTVGFNLSEWFEEQLGLKNEAPRDSNFGISTSTFLSVVSYRLGIRKLILSGMDLAYTSSKRYAPGITAHPTDNLFEKKFINLDGTGKTGIPAVNVKGEEVQTTNLWRYESYFYSEFLSDHPDLSIINASEVGLRIERTENRPLQDIAHEICLRSYDLNGRINACIQNSKIDLSFEKIQKSFDEWQESCKKVSELTQEIIEELEKIRGRLETESESLESIWTKEIDEIFSKIKEETVFKVLFNPLYHQLGFTYYLDQCKLDCHPEVYTKRDRLEKSLNFEKSRFILLQSWGIWHKFGVMETLRLYKEDQSLLESHQVEVNYPQPRKNASDSYLFDHISLKIHDEELGLHFEMPFAPSLISEERKTPALAEPAQQAIEIAEEKEGQWEGQYLLYYPSKKLLGESFYLQGKLHGPSKFYGEKGELLSETWFVNGQRQGKCWLYYSSGSLYALQRYRDGLFDGKQEYFYPSGKVKTLLNYKKGILHGEVLLYFSNGQKERELHFLEGKLDGVERHWEKTGQLFSESRYKEGQATDRSRRWYSNGQIATQFVYHESPEHFDHYEWDPEGNLLFKKLYLGNEIFDNLKKKSQEITNSINDLKAKLEKIQDKKK